MGLAAKLRVEGVWKRFRGRLSGDVLALKDTDARVQGILASQNPLEELHRYAKEVMEKDEEQRPLAGKIAWLGEYVV